MKSGDLENGLMLARQINLLAASFNKMFATLLVMISVHAVLMQIIGGYCLVRVLGGNENVFSRLLFIFMIENGFVVTTLVYGFCGEVHDASNKGMKRIKKYAHVDGRSSRKMKMFRRVASSMPVLKINFGSGNFVEKSTPIVFQQFTIERLVDLLLLSK